jgi:hypothetical protein
MFELIMKYALMPSTWKGIIGLVTAAGVTISPEMAVQIIAVGLALTGVINTLRNEKLGK